MAESRPPFRADHVGSLLRPASLKALRLEREAGKASAAQLAAAEDAAIREGVKLQEEAGLQGITDGEMRRKSWHMDFLMQLSGLTSEGKVLPVTFHGREGDRFFTRPDLRLASRVTRPQPIFVDAFKFLKSATTRTPKLTMPSPSMFYTQVGRANIDRTVYPDLDAFVEDLAAAYRAEIADLYAAGCRYLQLDDVSLAYLCDEEMRARGREQGDDPEAQLALSVKLIQATLRDRPRDLTVCTHLCRGNFRSSWRAQGGYATVAETIFTQLPYDGFFLSSSSTMRARGISPPSGTCPRTCASSWGSSAPRWAPSRRWTTSSAGSTKRPGISRSTSSVSAPSAASRRPWRATTWPCPRSGPSSACAWT